MTIRVWRAETGDVPCGECVYDFCNGFMILVNALLAAQNELAQKTDGLAKAEIRERIEKITQKIEAMENGFIILRRRDYKPVFDRITKAKKYEQTKKMQDQGPTSRAAANKIIRS